MPDTLESLTPLRDEELIESLATEVMGWEKAAYATNLYEPQWIKKPYGTVMCKYWHPLTDWNHTMEVYLATPKGSMQHFPSWQSECGEAFLAHTVILDIGTERICVDSCPSFQKAICLACLLAVQPSKR